MGSCVRKWADQVQVFLAYTLSTLWPTLYALLLMLGILHVVETNYHFICGVSRQKCIVYEVTYTALTHSTLLWNIIPIGMINEVILIYNSDIPTSTLSISKTTLRFTRPLLHL